jgi:hypothetical protein
MSHPPYAVDDIPNPMSAAQQLGGAPQAPGQAAGPGPAPPGLAPRRPWEARGTLGRVPPGGPQPKRARLAGQSPQLELPREPHKSVQGPSETTHWPASAFPPSRTARSRSCLPCRAPQARADGQVRPVRRWRARDLQRRIPRVWPAARSRAAHHPSEHRRRQGRRRTETWWSSVRPDVESGCRAAVSGRHKHPNQDLDSGNRLPRPTSTRIRDAPTLGDGRRAPSMRTARITGSQRDGVPHQAGDPAERPPE